MRSDKKNTPESFPSWLIVAGSAIAVAVVMGISRFSFTPLLPMMINDGVINLRQGGTLASANYLGYLFGALLCMWLPHHLQSSTIIKSGMAITVLLTFGMLIKNEIIWAILRFSAGLISALVLVHSARWCLTLLNSRGEKNLGSLMFTGVGAGIMLSGLAVSAMVRADMHAGDGWISFGVLTMILVAASWRIFISDGLPPHAVTTSGDVKDTLSGSFEFHLLAFSYGLAGFGYIITATFLPVIAHAVLPQSAQSYVNFFWPAYGISAIAGCFIAVRSRKIRDNRLSLVICYLLQAFGVAAVIFYPTVSGFFLSSLLAGLPFNAINFYAMQEVTRLKPQHAARYMGLLTALFSVGQFIGPPMTNAVMALSATTKSGFSIALEIAAASLILGAMTYLYMIWKWRMHG